jgi:hypothetical protein
MKDNTLQRELFLLVGYLLTSARGLYDEPAGYGPFRLMDTAGRLLEIMQEHDLSDPFLADIQNAIAAERFGTGSDEQLKNVLDQLSVRFAKQLKERYQTTGDQEREA